MKAHSYRILQPNLVEKRENQFLLVWKDIPHWMVVNEEAYNLIRLNNGSRNLKDVKKELYGGRLQKKKIQEIKSFFFILKKKGLVNPSRS